MCTKLSTSFSLKTARFQYQIICNIIYSNVIMAELCWDRNFHNLFRNSCRQTPSHISYTLVRISIYINRQIYIFILFIHKQLKAFKISLKNIRQLFNIMA